MDAKTYYKLEKIAAGYSTNSKAGGFIPSDLHILDTLGMHETDYNPYESAGDFNKHYIRTRQRGTWGDPDVPREEWTSSSAWTPWQITRNRSADIAKYDSDYAKLHTSTLDPVFREMLRTGLSKRQYAAYKSTGKLPPGFKGAYNANADYGGNPRKMSVAEHDTIRKGMLAYINKRMIPTAMKVANGDETRFWKSIASQHYLGHPWPVNAKERDKLDKYWGRFSQNIAKTRKLRLEHNRRKLDELNASIKEYSKLVSGPNGREYEAPLKQRIMLKKQLENANY